jgi:excinuclease ABC subunit A
MWKCNSCPTFLFHVRLCQGKRFKDDLLEITLGRIKCCRNFGSYHCGCITKVRHFPKTHKKLTLLNELGLGYLKMGQPLGTLSGGESQRLKACQIYETLKKVSPAILLIDEPTTGLHLSDVQQLVDCLKKTVASGNSLFVIEHHPISLCQSDWILELGPGAGKLGGKVIAEGSPRSFRSLNTATVRLFSDLEKQPKDKQIDSKFKRVTTAEKKTSKYLGPKKTTSKT